MKSEFYCQCELTRPTGVDRLETMVSWIPEKIAKVGNIVRLKDKAGEWTEGWKVTAVYDRQPYTPLEAKERDYKRQRKASDI